MVDVSIIIPNKNGAKHLHDCLGSVVVPTDFSYEVCVVDDGSTDESWEILNYYRTQFPNRFYFYQSPGSGAAAARNFGFQQSSGQYIQFLDADDQLGPGKIQTQLDCLQWAVSGTIASCRWQHFLNQPGDLAADSLQPIDHSYDDPIDWLLESWLGKGMGQTGIWLTPRHLIEQAGPWDESLTKNQDGEFFCRVLLQASHIEFVPDATVYYRKPSAGNVSQNQSHEAAKSLFRSYQSYHREALKYEDSPRVRKALALNYLNFIYRIHPLYPDLQARAWESAEQLGHSFARQKVGGTNFRYLAQVLGLKGALKLRSWLSFQSKHA